MIVVILKDTKEVIKFSMRDEEKERALVNKFSLGSVKQKSKLKLPQLDRELFVYEILDMKFVDHWGPQREQELEDLADKLSGKGEGDSFVNGMYGDIFGDIFGGCK